MSARSRANGGRVNDVGRAPSPAAFAAGVALDFSAQGSLTRSLTNANYESPGQKRRARAPALHQLSAPLARQL